MTTAVARIDDASVARLGGWTPDHVALLRDQIAPGATPGELALLASYCKRTGLDPFSGQVHGIVRKDRRAARGEKMTIQVGIDGLRALADDTGKFAGKALEQWWDGTSMVAEVVRDPQTGDYTKTGRMVPDWLDAWVSQDNPPAAARYGVWRDGAREPIIAVATWQEYAQRWPSGDLMGLWGTLPATMLSKCAEAKCLRQAFPKLSGLYAPEEVSDIDADNGGPDDGSTVVGTITVEGDGSSPRDDERERAALRVSVNQQVPTLTPDEVRHLRALAADARQPTTTDGLIALAGDQAHDLRAFLKSKAPRMAWDPPGDTQEAQGAQTTPAPAAPGGSQPPPDAQPAEPRPEPLPERPRPPTPPPAPQPQPPRGHLEPVDLVAAAWYGLADEERQRMQDVAIALEWGDLSPQTLLDVLGGAATQRDTLAQALTSLEGMVRESAAADQHVAEAARPVHNPDTADVQNWMGRGTPPPDPADDPNQERLL